MSDDFDVLTRLVDYHDHIAAPRVPVADDVRRGRRRVTRTRALAAGGVALAAAGVVLAASLVTRGDPDGGPEPAPSPPTQTPKPNQNNTAVDPNLRNGTITDTETHFAVKSYSSDWRDYDPLTDTGLYVTPAHAAGDHEAEGLVVVGPKAPVATLRCDRDVPCAPEYDWLSQAVTLGPGADEVTVASGDHTAQVIGYDGTVRRTVDLTPAIGDGGQVRGVRWSPDGSRLAVVTGQDLDETHATRVWLVDGEGGDAEIVYSQSYHGGAPTYPGADADGEGQVWTAGDWGWSPDGQTLLLDVYRGLYASDVVLLHLQPEGTTEPVIAQTLFQSNRHFDWRGNVAWSPDGTRIAVRTRVPGTTMQHRVTEISAEDGSVIAQHPHLDGWLIWPASES